MSAKSLIRAAAFLMIVCAVLHSIAWTRANADFSPEVRQLAALLWFLLGIDWIVVAGLWIVGAGQGIAARRLLLLCATEALASNAPQ